MKAKKKYEDIYLELKDRILYNIYPNQHHLIIEPLAAEFSVSRSSIQRALQDLEKEHMVVSIPQKGFYVDCPDQRESLLGLRNELEISAMRQVVERVSEEELTELQQLGEAADRIKLEYDLVHYVDAEIAFHSHLVACSRNDYLISMHANLQGLLKQYLSNYYEHLVQAYRIRQDVGVIMSHCMVVEAIRFARYRSDADLAMQVLNIHLTPTKGIVESTKDYYKKDLPR